jgi:hypothetical protein
MNEADPAAAYEALRAETAGMLKYDLADLSLVQGLQVDLVSLLRLEVDTLQGKVLAGEQVDLMRLSAALTMLHKLLPPAELKTESSKPDFSGAREELERFLQNRFEAIEYGYARESEIEAEVQADFYRDAMRPPAPARIGPPAPARVVYVDHAVINDRDEPVSPPALAAVPATRKAPSSDAEWARWYQSGSGSVRQAGWGLSASWLVKADNEPKGTPG